MKEFMSKSSFSINDGYAKLIKKIEDRTLKSAVFGLGYVGWPLCKQIARSGFLVAGFDTDYKKIESLKRELEVNEDLDDDSDNALSDSSKESDWKDLIFLSGLLHDLGKCDIHKRLDKESSLPYTGDEQLEDKQAEYKETCVEDSQIDLFVVCVPTPLDENRKPDFTLVNQAARMISRLLKKNGHQIVILESTVSCGYTENEFRSILESKYSGQELIAGKDFYLGFAPERIDPGNKEYSIDNTPKIVSGINEESKSLIHKFYSMILSAPVYSANSCIEAELCKLLENSYRNVNIALIEEFAKIANKAGVSVHDVIDLAKTKPYGFEAFVPGLGIGGHCIPVDPHFLLESQAIQEQTYPLIETAISINDRQTKYCCDLIEEILSSNSIGISESKILILGIGYKPGMVDIRESPSIKLMNRLLTKEANVFYWDPLFKDENEIKSKLEIGISPQQSSGINERLINNENEEEKGKIEGIQRNEFVHSKVSNQLDKMRKPNKSDHTNQIHEFQGVINKVDEFDLIVIASLFSIDNSELEILITKSKLIFDPSALIKRRLKAKLNTEFETEDLNHIYTL